MTETRTPYRSGPELEAAITNAITFADGSRLIVRIEAPADGLSMAGAAYYERLYELLEEIASDSRLSATAPALDS